MKVLYHYSGSDDPNRVCEDITYWSSHGCWQKVFCVSVISFIFENFLCILVNRKEKSMKSWNGYYVCSITLIFEWSTFIKASYPLLFIDCGHCMSKSSVFLRFVTWRILCDYYLICTMIFNLVRVMSSGLHILTETNPAISPATKFWYFSFLLRLISNFYLTFYKLV